MSINFAVEEAIPSGQLPNAEYSLKYAYNAYLASSKYQPEYVFLVKLVNDKGDSYRLKITNADTENGEEAYLLEYVVYPNA